MANSPEIPPAPAFSANGYPLAGERIGPAWVAAWCLLHQHATVSTEDLVTAMHEHHGVAPSTARSLLGMAAKAGHICGARYGGQQGKRVLAWRLATEADRARCWLCDSLGGIAPVGSHTWVATSARASSVRPCPVCRSQTSTESADLATADTADAQAG